MRRHAVAKVSENDRICSSQLATNHITLEAGGLGLFLLRFLLRGDMTLWVLCRECHCDGELVVVIWQTIAHVVEGTRLVLMVGITFHGGRGSSARPT